MTVITRRRALLGALFGGGAIGLRALATGLPASLLLDPRRALADPPPPPAKDLAQYILFATSAGGDPMSNNVPGTYDDPGIVHPLQPSMAPTPITIGGRTYRAAAPWATLPQRVLDRTTFWHIMTDTPVHPREPEVLSLMGATIAGEMLPSILSKHLATSLGTIQSQPLSVGAVSPTEALAQDGQPLPIVPPSALKATLTSPDAPITDLQRLRDRSLAQIYDVYKSDATPAQRRYIETMITSERQARAIEQRLLEQLHAITDDGPASQILAALTLFQMNVTPVVAVHIPFGGDNHRDPGLTDEATQTVSGVASIVALMEKLAAAGLEDRVSLVTLNVFGRTMGPLTTSGRQHNPNHQVSLTIGQPFRGAVIGGVGPVAPDFGALPIDSKTGEGTASGDIAPKSSLAAFGCTVLSAVGGDPRLIGKGTVVRPALA
jgi:hypothetical protein